MIQLTLSVSAFDHVVYKAIVNPPGDNNRQCDKSIRPFRGAPPNYYLSYISSDNHGTW